jgi:hypothetical protein
MHIVEPEIQNDELFDIIKNTILSSNSINYGLEIGASTGEGSTKAFFEGLKDKKDKKLVCIEGYNPSYELLKEKYKENDWIHCLNMFSTDKGMTLQEMIDFMCEVKVYPYHSVNFMIGIWHDHEQYRTENKIENNGLEFALNKFGIPDIALIDGSAFTGYAEFQILKEVKHIILDDIDDIKCYQAWKELENNKNYELRWINTTLRNGGCYYEKVGN